MSVRVYEAESRSQLRDFVNLPFAVYKGNKYWVPQIKQDELKALIPETNPAFEFCTCKFWLAEKDGRIAGGSVESLITSTMKN